MTYNFASDAIDWTKSDGLVPVIVQDANSLRVLMLGYFNQEALRQTIISGLITFYSRSKKRLWQKGESSGHFLRIRDIKLDCDGDTFLIQAEPEGPTCHRGTQTCFEDDVPSASLSVLADLVASIHKRYVTPEPGSYTTSLFAEGITRIAQKVGEEGVETALAGATQSAQLASEAADLIYHLLVLLKATHTDFGDVLNILHARAHRNK